MNDWMNVLTKNYPNEWMNEWMSSPRNSPNEWMNEGMNECPHLKNYPIEWISPTKNSPNEWNEWVSEWMSSTRNSPNEWMNEWMDECPHLETSLMNEWMNEWMNERHTMKKLARWCRQWRFVFQHSKSFTKRIFFENEKKNLERKKHSLPFSKWRRFFWRYLFS
jgi:hypothetical protein